MNTETDSLTIQHKAFFTIARDWKEYLQSIIPTDSLIEELHKRHVDIFSFLERKWCCPITKPSNTWAKTEDNIAILHLTDYEKWLKDIGKKTRNIIRKAQKTGITTSISTKDDKLAEGISKIFNETPIRQGRGFPNYGMPLEAIKTNMLYFPNSTYIGAYFENELVGYIRLIHGDQLTMISDILSMQKHWDKSINNALLAKAIEFCAINHIKWIMYGRMGNHPTLDIFKENNGFKKLVLTRYFIPLSRKGRLAVKLKLEQELKDMLPPSIKNQLLPLYDWVSRTRAKARATRRFKKTQDIQT